jgi:hypothetical protein
MVGTLLSWFRITLLGNEPAITNITSELGLEGLTIDSMRKIV